MKIRCPATFAAVKGFITSILLLVLSFQAFYPAGFTVWFYANRAAIAKQYCINKKRPMLHCDGKCYLARKIQAAEDEQNREANTTRNVWVEAVPFILSEISLEVPSVLSFEKQHHPFVMKPYGCAYLQSVFRPPGVVSV
jgi:hypothetical protein